MNTQKEIEKMVEEMAKSILEYNLKHNVILYILILIMFIFNCVALTHRKYNSKIIVIKECKSYDVLYSPDVSK